MQIPWNRKELEYEITESGCWICTSHKPRRDGYIRIRKDGKPILAHRWVYEQKHGKLPPGMCVCHHCDNRACLNDDHFFAGTQIDNIHDMVKKGRGVNLKGELNGKTKLTDARVREMRLLRTEGWSPTALAERYGITASSACKICLRQTWRHVQ